MHRSPCVGAIRWDAWSGGDVTRQVERTLGPPRYHSRLPWFADVVDHDTVRIGGNMQAVMDQEIDFAAAAGLDYWAFLVYPEAISMSDALKAYLRSSRRHRINFCLILHNSLTVSDEIWPRERGRVIALMREPGYQRVLDDRPLVFTFGLKAGDPSVSRRLNELKRAAAAAGMHPYYVYMGWKPVSDYQRESAAGYDAVSAYAKAGCQLTFGELAAAVETDYWKVAAEAGVPYIPLVTTGWDKRPRKDHPVSWELTHSYHKQDVFPATATPAEIAAHLRRALRFVGAHPDCCAANAIIVYAWNEHDEGGWLCPTWTPHGPDTARLDAVRDVLRLRSP